jgi:ubiquinone/menaquinone biosynthesis C-methylase UbiE
MFCKVRRGWFLLLAFALFPHTTIAQTPAAELSFARPEESARETWQKVREIFEAMGVRPGAIVADVGAGDGFLTVRLARAVGATGRVVAVDVSARALERLRARLDRERLTNVETIKGDADDPHLPSASLDAAVIVNSYHEMASYQAMLRHLRAALKPDARLVIVEPISDKHRTDSRERQVSVHEIAAHFVEQEARDAGLRVQRLQEPFTVRRDVIEWMLVVVPDPLAFAEGAICPLPSKTPATSSSSSGDDEAAVANPDLRIAFDTFRARLAEGAIVVVDVRSEGEFESGHIPGAIWIPLHRVKEQVPQLRAKGKPIVTYCS